MMKFRLPALCAFLLLALVPAARALDLQPKPPGLVATTANANLRAKPTMDSEILVTLKKGDVLVQTGTSVDPKAPADEPKEWVEIAAPAGTKVWIFAALVDPASKTVRSKKANLRAGPGRNYAEVGSLRQGDALHELRSADGWIQIAAPEGAVTGFVAQNLVQPAEKSSKAKPSATNAQPAFASVRRTTSPVPLPPETSDPIAGRGRALPAEPAVVAQPLNSIPTTALQPALTRHPKTTIQTLPETVTTPQAVPIQPAIPANSVAPIETPSVAAEPPPTITLPAQPEIVHTDKPRVVMREGVVGIAMSPQSPSDYQLNNFRKGEGVIGFLATDIPEIKLSSWRWRRVLIMGEEYIDARWPKLPLIKVTSIQAAY